MKCEQISRDLIAYLDRRSNSAERREVEEHLAACAACRRRAEEFPRLWNVLDEVPPLEPSLGFDARVRQRIAAEPRQRWFGWLVPAPRLAFSLALLLALSVWIARLPQEYSPSAAASQSEQDFRMIKNLGVLENYDVLKNFDALSELQPQAELQPPQNHRQDDGGM